MEATVTIQQRIQQRIQKRKKAGPKEVSTQVVNHAAMASDASTKTANGLQQAVTVKTHRGWLGEIDLDFFRAAGKTTLHRHHIGPLRIQRPFYPESTAPSICHVYLLHPPGGVVGGDRLNIRLNADESSHAVLTSPGATKFYRSAGPQACLIQEINVNADAVIEWLPQENIFFDRCNAAVQTRINLKADSGFCAWDIQCFGRTAGSQPFLQGDIRSSYTVSIEGELQFAEQLLQNEQSNLLTTRSAGLRGNTVNATMVLKAKGYTHPSTSDHPVVAQDVGTSEMVELARTQVKSENLVITALGDLLVARYLGHRSDHAKHLFAEIRSLLRPALFGVAPHNPRIWQT